ncbi:MAG: indolepyruvate oxidoreductase subunit beta [Christensenellaceae bacterium]|jgi:indolepyruvate ferredoxin oxidoreductase beta subunit|nr:indolepyruvate oxidoreductase subunit beta [Christensenellaceae bacterium]
METNIIVTGVGGQGSILASHIIAEAALKEHGETCRVRVGETFGAAQRGGAVASHVRIGEGVYGPLLGRGTADLIIALEPMEALRLSVPYLAAGGTVVMNTGMQVPVDVKVGAVEYPSLEAIQGALQRLGKRVVAFDGGELASEAGSAKVLSMVMLGAAFASGLLPFCEETVLSVVAAKVPQKTIDTNLEAFALGKKTYQQAVHA